jgi:hypothetical protein
MKLNLSRLRGLSSRGVRCSALAAELTAVLGMASAAGAMADADRLTRLTGSSTAKNRDFRSFRHECGLSGSDAWVFVW